MVIRYSSAALHRFSGSSSTGAMVLSKDHPAIKDARPLFVRSANEHKRHKARVLVSGHNSRKIGKFVTKGKWSGFPIFTLTLEERRTCPRSCEMWNKCYGNRMPWSLRWPAGRETEERIKEELSELQNKYPYGFVIRLHILGDFYSVEYVNKWASWLDDFPALHVFGFTARTDTIGAAVAMLAAQRWNRFAVRSSGGGLPIPAANMAGDGVRCPVESRKTECCGTCALCWAAPTKTIVFSEH